MTNSRDYADAVARWCNLTIHGAVLGGTLDHGRRASYQLQLFNTTSSPVRVESQRFEHLATHWSAASVLVPARGKAVLTVSAEGAQRRPTPWNVGLLVATAERLILGAETSPRNVPGRRTPAG